MTACRARPCVAGWPKTTSSHGAGTCGASPMSTANTSPAWRTCSTSTPRRRIPPGRWSASTRPPSSSSARSVSRFQPSRDSASATITSTAATAPSISSLPSTRIVAGATSRSPSTAPPWTTPTACANSSMSIIPTPTASASCRTICRSIPPARCIKHLRLPRPVASCAASNSTSPRNTPVGSIWSSARSACSSASASAAASTTPKGSETRSQHGKSGGIKPEPASNGCSQPTRPAPNSAAPIQPPPKSQNHCDEPLDLLAPVRRDGFPSHSLCEAVQEQFDRRVGEFLRANSALGVVPGVSVVDDPEEDHRVDLLGTFDDPAFSVEPDQEIGDDVDQLPLKILDGLLLILVKE